MMNCLPRWGLGCGRYGLGLALLVLGIARPAFSQAAPPRSAPSLYLEDLTYFEGTWACQIKEVTYDWTVERTLADFWFEGAAVSTNVETLDQPLTTEVMGHDASTGALFRIIFTAEGNYLGLESNGWRDGELFWEGEMVRPDRVLPLEGTVTQVSDNQFTSVFFAQLGGPDWVPVQEERCDRILEEPDPAESTAPESAPESTDA